MTDQTLKISSFISFHYLPPPLCIVAILAGLDMVGWQAAIHSHPDYVPSCAAHAGNLKHFLTPLQLGLLQLDALA